MFSEHFHYLPVREEQESGIEKQVGLLVFPSYWKYEFPPGNAASANRLLQLRFYRLLFLHANSEIKKYFKNISEMTKM